MRCFDETRSIKVIRFTQNNSDFSSEVGFVNQHIWIIVVKSTEFYLIAVTLEISLYCFNKRHHVATKTLIRSADHLAFWDYYLSNEYLGKKLQLEYQIVDQPCAQNGYNSTDNDNQTHDCRATDKILGRWQVFLSCTHYFNYIASLVELRLLFELF